MMLLIGGGQPLNPALMRAWIALPSRSFPSYADAAIALHTMFTPTDVFPFPIAVPPSAYPPAFPEAFASEPIPSHPLHPV